MYQITKYISIAIQRSDQCKPELQFQSLANPLFGIHDILLLPNQEMPFMQYVLLR
jgi:hypothetical protein